MIVTLRDSLQTAPYQIVACDECGIQIRVATPGDLVAGRNREAALIDVLQRGDIPAARRLPDIRCNNCNGKPTRRFINA